MIQMPRRSVTRFFIPLIDVMTLMFCIYLLMPLMKSAGSGEGSAAEENVDQLKAEIEKLKVENAQLKRDREETPDQIKKELAELREMKRKLLEDLAVRVLQIDPQDGKLTYYDGDKQAKVTNDADVAWLIDREKRAAAAAGREMYFLIQYPHDPRSPHPTGSEKDQFENWFRDVAHGWDRPGSLPTGNKP
jgi:hypothetical protein